MNVSKQTTLGVTIIAESRYEEQMAEHSDTPFNFSYRITIINESNITLQLLRREWRIFDTYGAIRQVKGEGVIGEQPVILPNQSYEYSSWCGLYAPIGNMSGAYEMIDLSKPDEVIKIIIPKFILCVDYLKN